MSVNSKFQAGAPFPAFAWSQVGGGVVAPSKQSGWRMIVVYRGKHCPLCTQYLGQLNAMRGDFENAGLSVWALSADPVERASEQVEAQGWSLPVLAGLNEQEMRELGLYISSPLAPGETDRNFAEPGIFVINPDGNAQIIDVSNAPFARPDPIALWNGLRYVMTSAYPVRGIAD